MEKMNDLRDLLKHEIDDLLSAEEQIIEAMPSMIEKASNTALSNSLSEHLRITREQKERLDKVIEMMSMGNENENGSKKKKFLGIFGGGSQKCKGMEGIIGEGRKMMDADMDPDVKDAALIACAQKIEHYEICGYGTARSYANELGLTQIANLLEMTLDEEYEADDKLTFLAESRINKQAEKQVKRPVSEVSKQKTSRAEPKTGIRQKEVELEPVSSRRQQSETKKNDLSERGGRPKAAATPRAGGGRPASSSSRRTASNSRSASKSARSGENSTKGGRSGNQRSR